MPVRDRAGLGTLVRAQLYPAQLGARSRLRTSPDGFSRPNRWAGAGRRTFRPAARCHRHPSHILLQKATGSPRAPPELAPRQDAHLASREPQTTPQSVGLGAATAAWETRLQFKLPAAAARFQFARFRCPPNSPPSPLVPASSRGPIRFRLPGLLALIGPFGWI